MKVALVDGKPVEAQPNAPKQAICPTCGEIVTLRHRKRMGEDKVTYFWRHQNNQGRDCGARKRPYRA